MHEDLSGEQAPEAKINIPQSEEKKAMLAQTSAITTSGM